MQKWMKVLSILGLMLVIVLAIYAHQLDIFNSPQKLQAWIQPLGYLGVFLFILFQIIQVIIPIFPGGVSSVAGILLFGPILGLIYSCIGLIIGECLGFLLVRKYGRAFMTQLLSEKNLNLFDRIVAKGDRHIEKILIVTLLIPFAPDDISCYAAGLTKLSFSKFLVILLTLKPISVAGYSYFMLFILQQV